MVCLAVYNYIQTCAVGPKVSKRLDKERDETETI